MDKLQPFRALRPEVLQEPFYFDHLLREAQRAGLLTEADLGALQVQLGQLLAHQALRYTHGESSSVKTETAQDILQSVCYSVGAHLKTLPGPEAAVGALKETALPELFRLGQARIKEQFDRAKQCYADILSCRIPTDNIAYNDTLDSGIPAFFRDYDREFFAHETPGMIDYPAGGPPIRATGIEYMEDYLSRLLRENRFCAAFSAAQIQAVLSCYHPGYADLLINIGELVQQRLLPDGTLPELRPDEQAASVLVFEDGKPMDDDRFRAFTEELRDCRYLSDKISLLRAQPLSFSDLLDVLGSGCFFGDEYAALYASLEEAEIALLLQHTNDSGLSDFYELEPGKPWQAELKRFLEQAPPERRERIEQLSEMISRRPEETE